ncbi:MAG: polyprenyl synthetase family protein [Pyrodictiaceae archaeon]
MSYNYKGKCFDEIVRLWRNWRKIIDKALESSLSLLPEAKAIDVARYIVEGGKRFRGFLTILVAEAFGAEPEAALDAAVAVELVHAASLAQDDIIDVDYERRGHKAAWVVYGVGKTVMVSNLLVPYSQSIVYAKYGVEALARTVKAWLDISRGEVLDAFIDPMRLPPTDYTRIARLKTGSLFRLACELGAIAAGAERYIDSISAYGEDLGLIYQFADDIVDLALFEKGKLKILSPSTQLFKRLYKNSKEAINRLRQHVAVVAERALSLPFSSRKKLLANLPAFMADAMLREAGLSLNDSLCLE